jgi:hypothetical protein
MSKAVTAVCLQLREFGRCNEHSSGTATYFPNDERKTRVRFSDRHALCVYVCVRVYVCIYVHACTNVSTSPFQTTDILSLLQQGC